MQPEGPVIRFVPVVFVSLLAFSSLSFGQAIAAHEPAGTARAFILIRDSNGTPVGSGEVTQVARNSVVSSTLKLRFLDGSIDTDTSRYRQGRTLSLISDHHVQSGKTFPKPVDMTVDEHGNVSTTTLKDGLTKTETKHIDLPPNIVNGMLGSALLNLPEGLVERKYSFITPSSSARLIQLKLTSDPQRKFKIAGSTVTADVYRIHYDLGTLLGTVAAIVGKQPPDTLVWVASGVRAIVREEAALYEGGPILSLELAGSSFEPISKQTP